MVNQKLTQEQINVRARCREFFYRLLAGEHLVKIAGENLESAKKLLDIAEKRVRLGESRPIELVKARVEFFSLEREYDKAKTTLQETGRSFNNSWAAPCPPISPFPAKAQVLTRSYL